MISIGRIFVKGTKKMVMRAAAPVEGVEIIADDSGAANENTDWIYNTKTMTLSLKSKPHLHVAPISSNLQKGLFLVLSEKKNAQWKIYGNAIEGYSFYLVANPEFCIAAPTPLQSGSMFVLWLCSTAKYSNFEFPDKLIVIDPTIDPLSPPPYDVIPPSIPVNPPIDPVYPHLIALNPPLYPIDPVNAPIDPISYPYYPLTKPLLNIKKKTRYLNLGPVALHGWENLFMGANPLSAGSNIVLTRDNSIEWVYDTIVQTISPKGKDNAYVSVSGSTLKTNTAITLIDNPNQTFAKWIMVSHPDNPDVYSFVSSSNPKFAISAPIGIQAGEPFVLWDTEKDNMMQQFLFHPKEYVKPVPIQPPIITIGSNISTWMWVVGGVVGVIVLLMLFGMFFRR